MARYTHERDITPTLEAAEQWIRRCLCEDGSLFSSGPLWTVDNVDEAFHAFVDHPDFGGDDFSTKLKGQMLKSSADAQRLMAEMLWALLLFPSNMKAATKRQQIRGIWGLSGASLPDSNPLLSDAILFGIGSGGPGFNNYRPDELQFLLSLTRDLKRKSAEARFDIFRSYDQFLTWIDSVPRKGSRQFRHMLRYFGFPSLVERISSNNDRRKILDAFGVASSKLTKDWSDAQLDKALLKLRSELEQAGADGNLDFYSPALKPKWSTAQKIKTADGEVTVIVPMDDDDDDDDAVTETEITPTELRPSFQIQAKLAEIGARMGFKVWLPRNDRKRICELVPATDQVGFLEELPLNYEKTTLDTIEQIDVIWLKGRSIVRAFEVEHTTAVYSGLLRMADLLALQPNMDIRLHIVAPDERRDKVFREMRRPVFSLLDRRPLSKSCTFISYEGVIAIRGIEHLSHLNDTIIKEYEETAED
ncbi:hypothetical protein IVB41_08905 [Bradyrhizobium sp. 44]|uniref:hypothetical protein n=1 Tax=Bradyrhizobium sp. 44 TaxID=2782675 RepID=UPI001FFA5D5E|nr:hypothetical protein [Bradyrhizobium sp. 44]MCK1284056.1 hypothetical protein [Bradyrhizobium sp. 44]